MPQILSWLYDERCQWLIVEGGAATLNSFIAAGAWDEIRIETAPITVASGTRAPQLPDCARLHTQQTFDGNTIRIYRK